MQGNRKFSDGGCSPSVGMCVCVLVERKCVKLSFLLSWSFARRIEEGGGVYASPPPDPSSLPQGLCFLLWALQLGGVCEFVCVCVYDCNEGTGEE